MIVDFSPIEAKLVLDGGITQKVLPYDSETENLKKGDCCRISFNKIVFKDSCLEVCNVSVTSIDKLSNHDLFEQGFLYKPFYVDWMRAEGFNEDDTIVKLDFKVKECGIE